MERPAVVAHQVREPLVVHETYQAVDRVSGYSHGGGEEHEVAQVEAQRDDAVAFGESRLQVLKAADVEHLPQPFGATHLHQTIEDVVGDAPLHASGEGALGGGRVGIVEGGVHHGDDAPPRHGAENHETDDRREDPLEPVRRHHPQYPEKQAPEPLPQPVRQPPGGRDRARRVLRRRAGGVVAGAVSGGWQRRLQGSGRPCLAEGKCQVLRRVDTYPAVP